MATVLGNKISSPPAAHVTVPDGSQIATSENNLIIAPGPGWFTKLGFRGQSVSGAPTVRLAAWKQDAVGDPSTLLGNTDELTVTTDADYAAVITNSVTENEASIRVATNDVLQVGALVLGGSVKVGIFGGGLLPYVTQSGVVTLSDPFVKNGQGQAALTFYGEFVPNNAPSAPLGLSPAAGATSNDFTPNFSATFDDLDAAPPTNDQPAAIEFQARRKDTGALVWQGSAAMFLADPTEQDSGSMTRTYAGLSLVGIAEIEWRCRFYDLALAPGQWCDWRSLTINQGAAITLTAPTGKVDGPSEDIAISGTYSWDDPSVSLRARIMKDGFVWKESGDIPMVLNDGDPFTLTSSDLGWGPLGAGLSLQAQVQAYDGVGWGAWSPPINFSTNAIPTAPANIQPPSGTVSSSPPTVTFVGSDPDDALGSETVGWIRITLPTGEQTTYSTLYNATAGEFYREFTSDEFPDEGGYSIECWLEDVSASDGVGPVTASAFVLQGDLVVTITSPTEGQVLADSTPPVSVSISSGTIEFARYILYAKDSAVPIYDSLVKTVTGLTIDDEMTTGILVNGSSYDLRVWAMNDAGLEGWSSRRQFTVAWNAASAPANFQVLPYQYPNDPEPTAALMTWALPAIPLPKFHSYEIWRWKVSNGIQTAVKLKQIYALGQNRWIDAYCPADGEYAYALKINTKGPNGEAVYSESATGTIDLPLSVIVIQSAKDPFKRLILRWKPAERKWRFAQEVTPYSTHGRNGLPIVVFGSGTQEIFEGSARLVTDEAGDRDTYFRKGRELYKAMEPVQIKAERNSFFGYIKSFELDEGDVSDMVRLRIEQISGAEGL